MATVAVIGAGVGGLAAAARLAAAGHAVHVFEQSATYGGKAGSLS
ncbi:MAG: NAD(P)-binding protein, partial [Actinomycetes bacterium]